MKDGPPLPDGMPRGPALGRALVVLLAVGLADYATGPDLGFYVFYFAPVAMAAWSLGRRAAFGVAVAATLVWYAVDALSEHAHASEWIRSWSTFVRLASFLVIGAAFARVRRLLDREVALNAELSRTLADVRQLSGLLPICASCKKIRNDQGYWERVEMFISERSQAHFTHSICPSCETSLYPAEAGEPFERAPVPGDGVPSG